MHEFDLGWRHGARRGLAIAIPLCFAACEPSTSADGGQVVWSAQGEGASVIPAYDSGTVYFASSTGELVAVDRRSGALRWRTPTDGSGLPPSGENVVLAGNYVLLGNAGIHMVDRATGGDHRIFMPSATDEVGRGLIATDGQTIYSSSLEGNVYAYDLVAGTRTWTDSLGADSVTSTHSPVLSGGVVYVGARMDRTTPRKGMLLALDAASGAELWRRVFSPETAGQYADCYGGVAVVGDQVIVPIEDGRIYALSRTTGAVLWIAPRVHRLPPSGPYNDRRRVAVVGDVVVVGSDTGILVGLDLATGAERWRIANGGSLNGFITHDESLAFAVHSLRLSAVEASTGRLVWRTGVTEAGGGEFYPAPASDSERLYVGGVHGLYALRKH